MNTESTPIGIFVESHYSSKKIQKVVASWRVEPTVIVNKLIDHFREMGIYYVAPGHELLILNNILYQLRYSADIQLLVHRARNDEMKRQRNRHAE
jgi:hypothetical protein